MMCNRDKPDPGYAPVYAALYPKLVSLARDHGYALAVHGSLQRDFDLVAIPWVQDARKPSELVSAIVSHFALKIIGETASRPHGRIVWTLSIGHGHCFLDLSFMPRTTGGRHG